MNSQLSVRNKCEIQRSKIEKEKRRRKCWIRCCAREKFVKGFYVIVLMAWHVIYSVYCSAITEPHHLEFVSGCECVASVSFEEWSLMLVVKSLVDGCLVTDSWFWNLFFQWSEVTLGVQVGDCCKIALFFSPRQKILVSVSEELQGRSNCQTEIWNRKKQPDFPTSVLTVFSSLCCEVPSL